MSDRLGRLHIAQVHNAVLYLFSYAYYFLVLGPLTDSFAFDGDRVMLGLVYWGQPSRPS